MRRVQSTLFALLAASGEVFASYVVIFGIFILMIMPSVSQGTSALKQAMVSGEKIYQKTCASCHQVNGKGIPPVFPAIKDSQIAKGPIVPHIAIILNGKPGTAMQAFKTRLNDQEVADVVTYQRNAWGNNMGDVIKAEQVKALRSQVKP